MGGGVLGSSSQSDASDFCNEFVQQNIPGSSFIIEGGRSRVYVMAKTKEIAFHQHLGSARRPRPCSSSNGASFSLSHSSIHTCFFLLLAFQLGKL